MEGMKANLPVFQTNRFMASNCETPQESQQPNPSSQELCAVGSDRSARDTGLQLRGQRTRDWTAAAAVIARSLGALLERLRRCLGSSLAAAV